MNTHPEIPTGETLPFMKTHKDAIALCHQAQDGFYLTAFMAQCWIGTLVTNATAEYAEKKNPRDRSLQTGEAWRVFLQIFGRGPDSDFPIILNQVFRFADCEDSLARVLRGAILPFGIEHECTGDGFGPKTLHLVQSIANRAARLRKGDADVNRSELEFDFATSLELARRGMQRWCDWLDAAIHLRTHTGWHLMPASFDPDPGRRELASLGRNQRHLAHLDDRQKAHWQWHLDDAACEFKDSPKWLTVGQAMCSDSTRVWTYEEVDTVVISLWPLVKAYNWTYLDLLNVIRPALKRSDAYPCDCEQNFATYCVNVLGLRKPGKGVTAKDGKPAGHQIAQKLLKSET